MGAKLEINSVTSQQNFEYPHFRPPISGVNFNVVDLHNSSTFQLDLLVDQIILKTTGTDYGIYSSLKFR